VAGAKDDQSFTPEQAELLDNALTAAGVSHTVEFYPAKHGFAVADNTVYDLDAAARHWNALRDLYGGAALAGTGRHRGTAEFSVRLSSRSG
jgi:carboxymethylenebutenolidase